MLAASFKPAARAEGSWSPIAIAPAHMLSPVVRMLSVSAVCAAAHDLTAQVAASSRSATRASCASSISVPHAGGATATFARRAAAAGVVLGSAGLHPGAAIEPDREQRREQARDER